MVVLSSIYNANSGELLTMAVALSAVLAQGQSQAQLAKLGAFFTIVGDTLNLYALEPGQTNAAASRSRSQVRQKVETETAVTSALSLGENL